MANELVIFIGRNILIGVNALMGQLDIGVNVRVLFKGMHVCVGLSNHLPFLSQDVCPAEDARSRGLPNNQREHDASVVS